VAGITVDGVAAGVLRSEKGKKGPFHQHDDGFAWVRSRGNPHGDLSGVSAAASQPLSDAKTVKMGRLPHNPGLKQVEDERLIRDLVPGPSGRRLR